MCRFFAFNYFFMHHSYYSYYNNVKTEQFPTPFQLIHISIHSIQLLLFDFEYSSFPIILCFSSFMVPFHLRYCYSITHTKRSILSLPCVLYSYWSQIFSPSVVLSLLFLLCNVQSPLHVLRYNPSKKNPPKTPFLQCMRGIFVVCLTYLSLRR